MDAATPNEQEALIVPSDRLDGDPAKRSLKEDDFGLDRISEATAAMLADRVAADGYTIGIEGEWGSGKTSFTNFIIEALEKRKSLTLKIIRFEPWLVGKRQALLGDLFRGLRARIEEFRTDVRLQDKLVNENANLIERLGVSLERYQFLLEGTSKGSEVVATIDPTLHAGAVAKGLGFLSWVAKKLVALSKPKIQTLEELRDKIKGDLRVLYKLSPNTRFLVVVDDVDRLEPTESIEILRLIRAVADFPLVTYLVCYDRTHLARQIRKVVGVGDGYDYLKKVFQNIISLPPQEAFALRRHTRKLLADRFREEFAGDMGAGPGRGEREDFFFDNWCGRLITTPRSAVRLAEAVTLGWPELKGNADFIDYVWLQLLKLECHDLYEWVRAYVVNVGAYRDGGRVGDGEPRQFGLRLRAILEKLGWELERDQAGLHYFLPGVEGYIDANKPDLFDIERNDLVEFETGRRLGSPSHWRLYFAFDDPSYALEDDILNAFRTAAKASNTVEGVRIIRELLTRPHSHPAFFVGTFLERLFDARDKIDANEQIGLARILGEVMDQVPPPTRLMGEVVDAWRRAETLLLPAAARVFTEICTSGSALNWLTDVIRTQGFAHQRPETSSNRGEPWLNLSQFETSLAAILSRIYALEFADLLRRPRPLTLLYCWLQLGNKDDLLARVDAFTVTDEGLLQFLDSMRTLVASSERGVYRGLQSVNVQHFMDLESTAMRVRARAADPSDEELQKKASEILDAWDWNENRR